MAEMSKSIAKEILTDKTFATPQKFEPNFKGKRGAKKEA